MYAMSHKKKGGYMKKLFGNSVVNIIIIVLLVALTIGLRVYNYHIFYYVSLLIAGLFVYILKGKAAMPGANRKKYYAYILIIIVAWLVLSIMFSGSVKSADKVLSCRSTDYYNTGLYICY